MFSKKWFNRAVLIVGLFSVLSGLLIIVTWSTTFESFWKKSLILDPSSQSYKFWIKTPMPLYMELYLFNWTNSDEFIENNTVKPNFVEVGPFVFREVHERVNITTNGSDLIIYNQTRTWNFLPERSINLSVPITNFNLIAFTIAKAVSTDKVFMKKTMEFLIHHYKEKLSITRPASEWLFDGIDDKLLDFIRNLHLGSVPFDKFGWFYGRNKSSTFDGIFSIKTGKKDIYNLGLLDTWNNKHKTKYFDAECGMVKGTTGDIIAPLKKEQENFTLFVTDFCGSLTLVNSGSTVTHGLKGYRFVGDERVFDNGTLYPEAKCYCTDSCSPSGVRNETSCLGAPLFLSFPHFYLADPIYINSIGGIKPNKSEHEFYLIINPLTGLPLEVRAQLQLNLLLEPVPSINLFSTLPKIYVPMMWFRQSIELTSGLKYQAYLLELLEKLGYGVGCFLLIIGILAIVVRLFWKRRSDPSKELLIDNSDESEDNLQNSNDEEP